MIIFKHPDLSICPLQRFFSNFFSLSGSSVLAVSQRTMTQCDIFAPFSIPRVLSCQGPWISSIPYLVFDSKDLGLLCSTEATLRSLCSFKTSNFLLGSQLLHTLGYLRFSALLFTALFALPLNTKYYILTTENPCTIKCKLSSSSFDERIRKWDIFAVLLSWDYISK